MIRSRSSKDTSPDGQLGEPAQRAEAGGGHAAVLERARLGEVLALEVGEAEFLAALERGLVARRRWPRAARPAASATRSTRGRSSAAPRHVDAHDRAQRHELLDVVDQPTRRTRPARSCSPSGRAAGGSASRSSRGVVGLDLQHGAVGAHGRRADLDEEVARDRHPRGMAAGQRLEADVAERLDQQRRGRLGVHGRVAEVDRRRRSAARSRRRRCARPRSDGGRPRPPGRPGGRRGTEGLTAPVVGREARPRLEARIAHIG